MSECLLMLTIAMLVAVPIHLIIRRGRPATNQKTRATLLGGLQ